MLWEIRFGAPFTDDDLAPEVYDTDGGRVEARLIRGAPPHVVNPLAAAYVIDGTPWSAYEPTMRPGQNIATKESTEVFGAVRAFAVAGVAEVALCTGFTPPHPDLAVVADGADAFLEVTQVRPEAEFTTALHHLERLLRERTESDGVLAQVVATRRIDLGIAALPRRRRDLPALADEIAVWLAAHDWRNGEPPRVWPAAIEPFIRHIAANAPDPERPIRAAWLTNERPIPDHAPLILDAIDDKKVKTYDGHPLWLAITAVNAYDALREVKSAKIDPGQFERIYITDTQDAVTVKRLRT
jgi:hypothetical protein